MLNQRGGKSSLCRMIQDLIVNKGIPCPVKREPTEKTIMSWINQFQKKYEVNKLILGSQHGIT